MRRTGRGSTGKRERAFYVKEATVRLWRDTRRRAKLLAREPGAATGDDVLAAALRLLRRCQDRDAERLGIDLAPPPAPAPESDPPSDGPGFRGAPRPPSY